MISQSEAVHSKNRNFICSCGKAYLSYAALFTHIKQKHAGKVHIDHHGKAPGQIIRPRSENKRGRPRKNDKLTSEKRLKTESYNGFLDNNNQKNINLADQSNSIQNQPQFQNTLFKGFRSYKQDKPVPQQKSNLKRSRRPLQSPSSNRERLRLVSKWDEDEQMEFANPNNQLSNNTLALASIIIGIQQFFKQVTCLEIVRDEKLQIFSSYLDLKLFHAKKLLEKSDSTQDNDVFLLGNIICAFLNFCHQTVEQKAGYQQIVLLMTCLLQHCKQKRSGNILLECRKELIHECLPSFFQQYLERVIIKSKLNYWIFKQNNSFKVLIWFLNWLSVIQVNHRKNQSTQQSAPAEQLSEDNDGVQFDCPLFSKQVQKTQKSPGPQNLLTMKDRKGMEFSQPKVQSQGASQNSQQSSKLNSGLVDQSGGPEDPEDSQFDPKQSGKKQIIQMERLSSQVR